MARVSFDLCPPSQNEVHGKLFGCQCTHKDIVFIHKVVVDIPLICFLKDF